MTLQDDLIALQCDLGSLQKTKLHIIYTSAHLPKSLNNYRGSADWYGALGVSGKWQWWIQISAGPYEYLHIPPCPATDWGELGFYMRRRICLWCNISKEWNEFLPFASVRVLAWSYFSLSTLLSSAYKAAAASTPACLHPPPSAFLVLFALKQYKFDI